MNNTDVKSTMFRNIRILHNHVPDCRICSNVYRVKSPQATVVRRFGCCIKANHHVEDFGSLCDRLIK
jgi:hypothetical protein